MDYALLRDSSSWVIENLPLIMTFINLVFLVVMVFVFLYSPSDDEG